MRREKIVRLIIATSTLPECDQVGAFSRIGAQTEYRCGLALEAPVAQKHIPLILMHLPLIAMHEFEIR